MGSENVARKALPNFRTARVMGLLNVVFATQLLLCGLVLGGYVAVMPLFTRMMSGVQKEAEDRIEQSRAGERAALAEKVESAKSVEDKALAKARLEEFDRRPRLSLAAAMDMKGLGLNDPVAIGWAWAEVITGLVLNVALLASGVGLMHWKPWARKVGLATASLKLARLVLVYGFFVLVIVPPLARNLGGMIVNMATQQQAAMGAGPGALPDASFFARVYGVMYSAMGVGMVVVGSVYPLILLWQLTRPGVRSACSGAFVLPREPNQPC